MLFLTIVMALLTSFTGAVKSKELSDKNFEHDTQATTGHTTGDWLVNFCDRTNKECRNMQPMWDELAEQLYGRMSVAHVYM